MYNQNGTTPSLNMVIPGPITLGVYQHVVITFDGTTARGYVNGTLTASGSPTAYVPGTDGEFTIGMRADTGFPWAGLADEVAFYGSVLSADTIAAHFYAATNTSANAYSTLIQASSPLLYFRLDEPGDRPAANSGTFGAAANGAYLTGCTPGATGPRPSTPAPGGPFPGFAAGNDAVSFPGTGGGGAVAVPPLNLNANTVTITAWIKPNGEQTPQAGLVFINGSTTPDTGLAIDRTDGLMLAYHWGGNGLAYADPSYLELNNGEWQFIAMAAQPSQTTLYLVNSSFPVVSGTVSGTVVTPLANPILSFGDVLEIGANAGVNNFNGSIDEVAIFNRTLSTGEVVTEYAAAVGGMAPQIFTDLTPPAMMPSAGDPLILTINVGGTPPLYYTWTKNGAMVATGTSGVFEITNSAPTDAGTYGVTVTNQFGSVMGTPTSVTVGPSTAPIILSQNLVSRTLYPGGTLGFYVPATGGGIYYRWTKDGTVVSSGVNVFSYSVASVAAGDGGTYSVSLSNTVGTASAGPAVVTVATPAANSYEALIVAAAPEAWWRLNETAGSTTMFDSMGRHDGIYTNLTGAVPPVTLGAAGAGSGATAASFVSTSEGLGVAPFSPALNANIFSIEGWVNTSVINGQVPFSSDNTNGGSWLISDSGWWYGDCNGGTFGNNGNVNTAGAIVPGQWSHVIIMYDGTRTSSGTHYPFSLYVNGQTDGYIWGGSGLNNGAPFIIGARGGLTAGTFADLFFDGQVNDVAVYTRTLSSTEALAHYQVIATNKPPTFSNPLTSQTLTTGRAVSFTTGVSGATPITVQWYKGGSLIAGATTTTFTITNTALADTATYTIWATNRLGTASESATLTILPTTSHANVTNGLVLHLPFDGDTLDYSGRGNNGTPSTAPAPVFVPGIIGGQALQVHHHWPDQFHRDQCPERQLRKPGHPR